MVGVKKNSAQTLSFPPGRAVAFCVLVFSCERCTQVFGMNTDLVAAAGVEFGLDKTELSVLLQQMECRACWLTVLIHHHVTLTAPLTTGDGLIDIHQGALK